MRADLPRVALFPVYLVYLGLPRGDHRGGQRGVGIGGKAQALRVAACGAEGPSQKP